ncbi:unnamed protein product, partial [Prorocentrum cordatum]
APVPEAGESGECRLPAELVGKSTQCVCQCECHCTTEGSGSWSSIRWCCLFLLVAVGAFVVDVCFGRGLGRRTIPVTLKLEPLIFESEDGDPSMGALTQGRRPGRRLLLQDEDGAAVEWHERFLLARITGTKWVVMSKDFDLCQEDFGESDDLKSFAANGRLSKALGGMHVYLIDHFSFGRDRDYYMKTGEDLARPLRPDAAADPGNGADVVTTADAAGKAKLADAKDDAKDGSRWSRNDRCVFELKDGAVLAGGLEASFEIVQSVNDSRILLVEQDGQKRSRRTFSGALTKMDLVDFGAEWEIEGPRSIFFVCERIQEGSQGPVHRHYWRRSVLGLAVTDVGLGEHLLLSQLIEDALTIDQAQTCNLAAVELVSRRYCAIVMPELVDFVAVELASRAAALKGRRQTRGDAAVSQSLGPSTATAAPAKKGSKGSEGEK